MSIRDLIQSDERPFPSHPQVGRYFPSASIEDARGRLARTIERGDGLGVVIGSAGTGKSLLLQVLAAQHQASFDVVLLACAQLCTRRALLQAMLFELGLEYRLRDEGQLRLSLLDRLLSGEGDSKGLLLLVDEAQLLPRHLLEELRMVTNLVRGGAPQVRLVLAGLPALEESLAAPELESFAQRVATRCYVGPWTREETLQCVRAQLAASAPQASELFTADAVDAVFEATDGVPRLVNQLCDRALLLADDRKLDRVERAVVQAAWSDLQQLPVAWEAESASTCNAPDAAQDIVEFGSLGDEAEGQDEAVAENEEVTLPETASISAADAIPDESLDVDWAETERIPVVGETVTVILPIVEQDIPGEQSFQQSESIGAAYTPGAPFDDEFDEEEIVLDRFAAWDRLIDDRTPRVENRRDRKFATLFQDALNESAAWHGGGELERRSDDAEDDGSPHVHLTVVADPGPLKPIPLRTRSAVAVANAAALDPVIPEAVSEAHAGTEVAGPRNGQQILVIDEDDEPDDQPRPLHQVKFARLFTQLHAD